MKINNNAIYEKKEQLEKYKGYLPFLVREHIDSAAWLEFITSEGLLDEIMPTHKKMKRASIDDKLTEFIRWVNENPEYQDFLTE